MSTPASATLKNRCSAVMLLLAIACATSPPAARLDQGGPANGARLQVTNRSLDDLQVFVMRGGAVVPVGTVPSLSTRTLVVSASQLGAGGELQLLAGKRSDPYTHRSAAFTASVGQRIEWVIEYHRASEVVIVR